MAAASFRSVTEMFLYRVASTPDSPAFTYPADMGRRVADPADLRTMTWQEAGTRVRAIAAGLLGLGVDAEQRVAILSRTRVEWILADMGVMVAGAATTTLYPANTAEECVFILGDSDSVVVFTEHAEQTAKICQIRDQLPKVRRVVQIQPGGEASHDLDLDRPGPWVVTLSALEEAGEAWDRAHPGALDARAAGVEAEHLATLIYTSGTTGRPKGVELTHDCWVFEGEAMDRLGIMSPLDKQLLFLPLAHSFAKVLEIATIRIGLHTVVDGRPEALLDNLAATRPTFLGAVPRIFERVHDAIVRDLQRTDPVRRRIFVRAMGIGAEVSEIRQRGERPSRGLMLRYALARRLVLDRIHARFGGRLRFLVSGGAPLPRELASFFHAAGILILEGYGLTESSAASCVNRPEAWRFGSVGPALPGVEVRTDPVDGEILIRSRGVMRGYHALPDETARVLTEDGWLRTGDLGELDEHGFLTITGRKKDLFKTSGGKYVAPQVVEQRLQAASPWLHHAVIHGANRRFVTALLTLDEDHLRAWARDQDLGDLDNAALSRRPEVHAEVQAVVDRVNQRLQPHEQVRRFAILPRALSVDDGALTPTLKVRRDVVEERYRSLLDGFYAEGDDDAPV